MKTQHSIPRFGLRAAWWAVALAVGLASSYGQVAGVLTLKDGREAKGTLRWKASAKAYEFQAEGSPAVVMISVDKVAGVRTRAPAELVEAVKNVQAGKYPPAIPVLAKVMDDYVMLEHDMTAARYLAEAYQKTDKPKKALAVFEKVTGAGALSEDLLSLYADSLIADTQYAKALEILGRIVEQGSRTAAAVAQIKRGDIEVKKGNPKVALVDGYLRTVLLFDDVKQTLPEALYKAALCFDQVGQTPYAERMRRRLAAEFPQDPYAAKAKGGG
jgi:tetratricopeptide (TPR) repeat protein